MAEERIGEPTEPATPRRRQEARDRGHVARSLDLSAAAVLLAAVLSLEFLGGRIVRGIFAAASGILGGLAEVDGEGMNLLLHFGGSVSAVALGVLPFLGIVVLAAIGVNLAQVGFLWTAQPMEPRFDRLDPVEGMRRIFSGRSMARLLMGVAKALAVGAVVALTIWAERARLAGLGGRDFADIGAVGAEIAFTLSIRAVIALAVLALLEYGWQRAQYERDLRMSREEVREELKRYEGDPKIRERRRAVQRQLALSRMILRVPAATVVIANPTHVAVALEFDRERMETPVVAAKGAELMARRIRETALEHGVPVVERPELARAIYKAVDVGQAIPRELYEATAEILAFAYRLKGMATAA